LQWVKQDDEKLGVCTSHGNNKNVGKMKISKQLCMRRNDNGNIPITLQQAIDTLRFQSQKYNITINIPFHYYFICDY